MAKVFAVLLAAFVGGLGAAAAGASIQLAFGNWTLGTIERLLTGPDISEQPIGYRPPDLLGLQRLLLDGRYAALDVHFAGLQGDYLSGTRPELEYTLAYIAFDTTNPQIGNALDRWVVARPDSAAALVARARYRMYVGWWMGGYAQPAESPMERGSDWRPDARMYAEARGDLERALSIDPRNIVACARLIVIADRTGDAGMARGALDRAVAADPLSHAVHSSWVALLLDGPGGARAAREHVDSIRPEFARKPLLKRLDAQVLVHRARALADSGDTHRAIDLLFEAADIAESIHLLKYRARLLRKTGAADWAEADLERAHEYMPQMVRILAARASLYDAAGRPELAAQDFALALELDPYNPSTHRYLNWSHYNAGRLREAEAALTAAMRLKPDGADSRFRRGHLRLKKLGDPAGAAEDLAIAAEGYADSPQVWRLYLEALTDIEDCRAVDALAGFRRACEASGACRESQITGETRRVTRLAKRLDCAPQG